MGGEFSVGRLPAEGITHFQDSRIDTRVRHIATAHVGEMMIPIFHLDRAGVGLVNLQAGAKFESVVEGGAVEDRDVSGGNRESAQASDERLDVPVGKRADLIAQWAETTHVGRPCSANVGCGTSVQVVLRYQNHVERSGIYR